MFWFIAIGVVISLALAYLVNQLPRFSWATGLPRWARITITTVTFAVGITATALLATMAAEPPTPPTVEPIIVEIVSPGSGDDVNRPFTPAITATGDLAQSHSMWLAYRNQEGGPYMVQSLRCVVQGARLDCGGAVYLGAGKNDTSAFRLVVIDADASATSGISNAAKAGPQVPGELHDARPTGRRVGAEHRLEPATAVLMTPIEDIPPSYLPRHRRRQK